MDLQRILWIPHNGGSLSPFLLLMGHLPWLHATEGPVGHVAATVAPEPALYLPIVDAADPLHGALHVVSVGQEELPQPLVLELEGLRQFAVPVHALEVGLHVGLLLLGQVVALVAYALKLWRTHCVHPLDASLWTGPW